MPRISNVTTHGIEDSIIASGYPMRLETPENIKKKVEILLNSLVKERFNLLILLLGAVMISSLQG